MKALTPHEQFAREIRACLNRWVEESDIEDLDLAEIAAQVFNDWLAEDVVDFEPDPSIDWGDEDDGPELPQ